MKAAKRFLVRPRAGAQITAAIQYHAVTMQAPSAARGFVDELQNAYELIKRNPDAGWPRLEAELGMPGLRSLRPPGYPLPDRLFPAPGFRGCGGRAAHRINYLAALINYLGSP